MMRLKILSLLTISSWLIASPFLKGVQATCITKRTDGHFGGEHHAIQNSSIDESIPVCEPEPEPEPEHDEVQHHDDNEYGHSRNLTEEILPGCHDEQDPCHPSGDTDVATPTPTATETKPDPLCPLGTTLLPFRLKFKDYEEREVELSVSKYRQDLFTVEGVPLGQGSVFYERELFGVAKSSKTGRVRRKYRLAYCNGTEVFLMSTDQGAEPGQILFEPDGNSFGIVGTISVGHGAYTLTSYELTKTQFCQGVLGLGRNIGNGCVRVPNAFIKIYYPQDGMHSPLWPGISAAHP